MRTVFKVIALLGIIGIPQTASAQPTYTYKNPFYNCGWKPIPGTNEFYYGWDTRWPCNKNAATLPNQFYKLKTAVRASSTYSSLPLTVTALSVAGSPLIINGVPIVFQSTNSVTNEVSALYPPPPGQEWWGFESTLSIPPSPQLGSIVFRIDYTWGGFPAVVEGSSGAVWLSDNGDDLYGYEVVDGFATLPSTSTLFSVPAVSGWGIAFMPLLMAAALVVMLRNKHRMIRS